MAVIDIAENLARVRGRIAEACREVGRDAGSVRLVAVSKFHPSSAIRAAFAAGQHELGENYAQELVDKARELHDLSGLRFHFIGGLQRNKAKLLIGVAQTIETVASAAGARALHERAVALNVRPEVLLQVNVAGEAQKSGVAPSELASLVSEVRALCALELKGLMTIPPAGDLTVAEACYRTLAQLAEQHGLDELSMGMSDDLEVAVRAGSTCVRVGTAIFGPRG